jgi:hypothetical protein
VRAVPTALTGVMSLAAVNKPYSYSSHLCRVSLMLCSSFCRCRSSSCSASAHWQQHVG